MHSLWLLHYRKPQTVIPSSSASYHLWFWRFPLHRPQLSLSRVRNPTLFLLAPAQVLLLSIFLFYPKAGDEWAGRSKPQTVFRMLKLTYLLSSRTSHILYAKSCLLLKSTCTNLYFLIWTFLPVFYFSHLDSGPPSAVPHIQFVFIFLKSTSTPCFVTTVSMHLLNHLEINNDI